jgi:Flp pilus assembly protein TadG
MNRFLNRLRRDNRGVAIIELALYAPILATMTIGVVDMSNAFSRKLALEQAAQRAIEKVMQTTGDNTVEAEIIAEAADQANIPISQVTVSYRLECNGTHNSDYNASCADGEKEARYILIEVKDSYTPMFPIHFAALDEDGTYHIAARAGMRTQ